jgi:hypothetical protein
MIDFCLSIRYQLTFNHEIPLMHVLLDLARFNLTSQPLVSLIYFFIYLFLIWLCQFSLIFNPNLV